MYFQNLKILIFCLFDLACHIMRQDEQAYPTYFIMWQARQGGLASPTFCIDSTSWNR